MQEEKEEVEEVEEEERLEVLLVAAGLLVVVLEVGAVEVVVLGSPFCFCWWL